MREFCITSTPLRGGGRAHISPDSFSLSHADPESEPAVRRGTMTLSSGVTIPLGLPRTVQLDVWLARNDSSRGDNVTPEHVRERNARVLATHGAHVCALRKQRRVTYVDVQYAGRVKIQYTLLAVYVYIYIYSPEFAPAFLFPYISQRRTSAFEMSLLVVLAF